jgi:heat shock protein HtpX
VQELALSDGLPTPRIAVIDDPSPNAFATGRDPAHAVVAVTSGILGLLDRDQLKGLLAHELSHVCNRDILIASVAATLAGAITLLAQLGRWAFVLGGASGGRRRGSGDALAALLLVILAPIAATPIQLAISRVREYAADAAGASLEGDPEPLASALEKLDAATRLVPMAANPATAHLFLVNPLYASTLATLFSPPANGRADPSITQHGAAFAGLVSRHFLGKSVVSYQFGRQVSWRCSKCHLSPPPHRRHAGVPGVLCTAFAVPLARFPLGNLPVWLTLLTHMNPVSYGSTPSDASSW